MTIIWTGSEDKLAEIGSELISSILKDNARFVLLLNGQMGAGKTALTREIMYFLGLSRNTPVQSPTFSYFNDYEIDDKQYAHIDLYRMEGAIDLEDFFGISFADFIGVFIEWPNSSLSLCDLVATHSLSIEVINDGRERRYQLDKYNRSIK